MTLSEPSPEDIGALLYDLCVRLGFCLPPDEQAALRTSPPTDVDAFTEAVYRAEGLEGSPKDDLWMEVRETVRQTYEARPDTLA
ncbi:hypothetical protein [Actinomadura rugatobispora]|uniref:Uncharacterized protein n=1 Tax=Actinomadura rugatobispora TaxID=1994 RepID=A0ABW1AET9_9ACTN|nr:hypothetical protein GCM10010200_054330 [Actinomadura rugatobispora]